MLRGYILYKIGERIATYVSSSLIYDMTHSFLAKFDNIRLLNYYVYCSVYQNNLI